MSKLAAVDRAIYLPDHVQDEFTDPSGAMADVKAARLWEEQARMLYDNLRVVWVKPDSESWEHPGRWHVVRLHPGGNPELNQYFVIQAPDGSYCAPQQLHLDALIERDTFRVGIKRSYEKLQKARSQRQQERKRKWDELRRQFREELLDRLNHIYDPRVAITAEMKTNLARAEEARRRLESGQTFVVVEEGTTKTIDDLVAADGKTPLIEKVATGVGTDAKVCP